MRSRLVSSDALIIGSMRFGEADRILTLYTRERGRLGAIAKGVRRTTSKAGGRLEPFSLVRVGLHAGRGLYTVVEVDTIRTFQGVREELFRIEEGARLLRAVKDLFPEEERNVEAFNLLIRGVARLADSPDAEGAANVTLATRLKLLGLLGYAPLTGRCAVCGGGSRPYGFSPTLGGVVCGDCATSGVRVGFALSPVGLAALRSLMEAPLAEVGDLRLDVAAVAEVERVVVQTLAHHGH